MSLSQGGLLNVCWVAGFPFFAASAEFRGQGSDPRRSCDLSLGGGNSGPLTHCAGLGIEPEPVSHHSPKAADPMAPQRKLPLQVLNSEEESNLRFSLGPSGLPSSESGVGGTWDSSGGPPAGYLRNFPRSTVKACSAMGAPGLGTTPRHCPGLPEAQEPLLCLRATTSPIPRRSQLCPLTQHRDPGSSPWVLRLPWE